MRFGKGLIASMEGADNGVDGAVTTEEELQATTEVANAAVEVAEDSAEIDAGMADAQDAIVATDELVEVADSAQEAVESGEGMSEETAEMASIAIESIRNRLGFDVSSRLVPARESFGNTNTRMSSTKFVVETVGETLKKIWLNIKNFALRVWEQIKLFFAKIFGSTGALLKTAQAMKVRVAGLDSSLKPQEKELKAPALAKMFSIKGKANAQTMQKVMENTGLLVACATIVGKSELDLGKEIISYASSNHDDANLKRFLNARTANSANVLGAITKSFGAADVKQSMDLAGVAKGGKKKAEKEVFGPFWGGKYLVAVTTDSEIAGVACKSTALHFEGQADKEFGTTVPALDKSEIANTISSVIKHLSALEDFKKTQNEMDALTKTISKTAETVMAAAGKIASSAGAGKTEERIQFSELKEAVSTQLAFMNSFGRQPVAISFSMARGALDHASLSIKNLK